MRLIHFVASLGALAHAGLGLVQPDPHRTSVQADRTALSGQMELPRLVDLSAERLKVPIEYDPAILKGSVTLRLGSSNGGDGGISDAELWSLMNELLASRGFTTVRQPGARLMSVVRVSDAAGAAALALPDGDERTGGAGMPTTLPQSAPEPGFASLVIRLKHRAAKDVIDAVGKALTKATAGGSGGGSGSIVALGDANAPRGLVLISDLAPRIEQALSLIDLIDTPTTGSVVESVAVSNVTPALMATLVAQVSAKRELVSGGEKIPGEVLALPRGGGVMVIAPSERIEYWRTLIQSLDAGSGEGVEQRTYVPKAFAAGEVAGLIEQTAREVRGPSGELLGDASDDRWKLVIDDLTGALVVTATPTQHAAIGKLLERLESTPPAARFPVRSFVIQNRNVMDLLPIVQELMQTGILGASADVGTEGPRATGEPGSSDVAAARVPSDTRLNTAASTSGGPPSNAPDATKTTGTVTSTPTPTIPSTTNVATKENGAPSSRTGAGPLGARGGATLALSADESTNTLIAMGEPRLLEQLEALILQLDTRQAQVMLEVLLVSLTDNQTLDLGVELEKLNIGLGGETRGRLASLFGIANRSGDTPAVSASGGQAIILNPGDFSVVVRALQTLNKGRSLSMPSVLVRNNADASLDSILEQPFATTNTNNSVTSSTSFGGSLPAGTQLTIKPQIAEGDHLTLEYQVSLSSFTGSSGNPNLPPPRQQNKVQSVATIPDGHTVVVGGIDLNTDNQGTSQVPLLAQIPILGEAFKSRSNNSSKQKFYVFIRANILRSRGFEDLKYLSEVRTSEVGVDDGFPEVEPRVIR